MVVSILLYRCTPWTLTKSLEKTLDGNYTRMLRAVLNMSRRQHPTKQQLYGFQPPIMKTTQVRQTRHAGHWWRSKDELISDILLWTPPHGRTKVGRPARTNIQQLCADTGCSLEDLPGAMDDGDGWQEKFRVTRVNSVTWWLLNCSHCTFTLTFCSLLRKFFTRIYIKLSYLVKIICKQNIVPNLWDSHVYNHLG